MLNSLPASITVRATALRRTSLLAVSAVLFCVLPPPFLRAETPAEQVRRATQAAFAGEEFKGFQFYSPVKERFGVGTMFTRNTAKNAKTPGLFIGDSETWWAAGISDADKASLLKELFVPGKLGIQKISAPVSKSMDIKASLPFTFFKKLLTIGVDVNRINNSSVTVTAIQAEERQLNLAAFFRDALTGKFNAEIVSHIKNADYEIVTQDVVFFGYEATTEGGVQTKLTISVQAVPSTGKKNGASAELDSSIDTNSAANAQGSKPAAGAAKDTTKQKSGTDPTAKTPAPQTTTLAYKSDPTVPMIVAVYLADAPKLPAEGALTRPTIVPAQLDPDAFSRMVDSLQEKLGPPKGIVVRSSLGR